MSLFSFLCVFLPPVLHKTASVGTRLTESITASDPDPGLNGTLRFSLLQRLPVPSFVSPCYSTWTCVHVYMHVPHVTAFLFDPPIG